MSVKNPYMFNEGYTGRLSENDCVGIELTKNKVESPYFEHAIFEFPYDICMEAIDNNISVRQLLSYKGEQPEKYFGTLRDYQQVGVEFLLKQPRSMLGDSVGLGKTAEISGLINVLYSTGKLKHFIMAVETTAFLQTQLELVKFTGLKVVTLPSDTVHIKKVIAKTDWNSVDGLVIKHSTLKNNVFNLWLAQTSGEGCCGIFDTFILDESSVIKNADTQFYKYCVNISNVVSRMHMLNATSFEKHILDVYYQFDIMDPSLLPVESTIKRNYCVYKEGSFFTSEYKNGVRQAVRHKKWDMVGYKNESSFKKSLKYSYFGRQLKDVKNKNIVDHVYKVYLVQPNPTQLLLIKNGFHSNEVLNCPSLLEGVELTGQPCLEFNRKTNPKLDRLCELVTGELNDSSIVVYCWHKEAQYTIKAELEKIGRRCVIINGEDPKGVHADKEKLERIQKFNSGEFDIMITNQQKSLNLYGADAMILYSITATVGRLEQIRGRIDRHVDDKVRTFIALLYESTSEYELFTNVGRMRGKASKDLILDSETAIDYFMHYLDNN